MKCSSLGRALFVFLIASPVLAQNRGNASPFGFLMGEWDLTATPHVSSLAARIHGVPRLRGTWVAHRAADGSIQDEMRITDESGNPQSIVRTIRTMDRATGRWTLNVTEVTREKSSVWAVSAAGNEITATARQTDADGAAYVARTRTTIVSPNAFRYVVDRSYDGGKTWLDPRLTVDARRKS